MQIRFDRPIRANEANAFAISVKNAGVGELQLDAVNIAQQPMIRQAGGYLATGPKTQLASSNIEPTLLRPGQSVELPLAVVFLGEGESSIDIAAAYSVKLPRGAWQRSDGRVDFILDLNQP